jgi:hypothetical protein
MRDAFCSYVLAVFFTVRALTQMGHEPWVITSATFVAAATLLALAVQRTPLRPLSRPTRVPPNRPDARNRPSARNNSPVNPHEHAPANSRRAVPRSAPESPATGLTAGPPLRDAHKYK